MYVSIVRMISLIDKPWKAYGGIYHLLKADTHTDVDDRLMEFGLPVVQLDHTQRPLP